MKILILTDMHSDLEPAKIAYSIENPDLVLDCGDHEKLINISQLTPHYFISGNHEPSSIVLNSEGYPLPHSMINGVKYFFSNGEDKIVFTGIGGNYSNKPNENHINYSDIKLLSSIEKNSIDILLFHESPLNAIKNDLAKKVLDEIKRIGPKFVFSGHTGVYSHKKIEGTGGNNKDIQFFNLDDIAKGYGVLETKSEMFERKISRWR